MFFSLLVSGKNDIDQMMIQSFYSSGLRRGISCIFHAFRARKFVREHRLQLDQASHDGGVGVTLPEESKKGIPSGCGFDFPIPSLIFVGNLIALIYWIQSYDRRLE